MRGESRTNSATPTSTAVRRRREIVRTPRRMSTSTVSARCGIVGRVTATSAVTVGFGFLVALDEPPLDLRDSPLLVPCAQALVAVPFVVRAVLPVLRAVDEGLHDAAALD